MGRGASLSDQQPARDQKIISRWAALSMIGGVGSWFGGGPLHRVLAIAHPSQAVNWSSEGFLDECRSIRIRTLPAFPCTFCSCNPHMYLKEPQSAICSRSQYNGGDRSIDPAIGRKTSIGWLQTLSCPLCKELRPSPAHGGARYNDVPETAG